MSIRHHWVAVILLTGFVGSSPGQPPAGAAGQRDAMKKLDFLIGHWKGEGWMEFAPGRRRTFKGTESVQRKLDGLLTTMDGEHRGRVGDKGEEVVVHSAFAVISYDDKANRYRFHAFTGQGSSVDAEAKVSDGRLVWEMKIPQVGEMRYTIKLDDKGRWFEIGEVSQDGKAWRKFFEMTLERVESK
jgi:hypothetical protein